MPLVTTNTVANAPLTAYTLVRSRRKTLVLYVRPNGLVEVRAPQRLALSKIEKFVAEKAAWIAKKQALVAARQQALPQELPASLYAPGSFEAVVRALVKTWEERLGVEAQFVGIRKMTSRWGSCTAKTRRLRFNAALEYCTPECLEYVVVHELAHLLENNHSPRFWALVAAALPDYKAHRAELCAQQWLLTLQAELGRQAESRRQVVP